LIRTQLAKRSLTSNNSYYWVAGSR